MRERTQQGFTLWLGIVICVLAVVYLIATTLGWTGKRLETPEIVILAMLLLFSVGFLHNLKTVKVTQEGVELNSQKLERVEEAQQEQAGDIRAIVRFLADRFVTEDELRHLQRLERGEAFPYDRSDAFDDELRRLRGLRLIRHRIRGQTVGGMDKKGDLRTYFEMTSEGSEYLRLRDDILKVTKR